MINYPLLITRDISAGGVTSSITTPVLPAGGPGTSWNILEQGPDPAVLFHDRPWRWLLRVFAHAEAGGYGKYMETRLKHVCFTCFYVFFNEHLVSYSLTIFRNSLDIINKYVYIHNYIHTNIL